MIVRIAMERQYRLPEQDAARLNELDNETVAAVDRGDEEAFKRLYTQMLDFVRAEGRPLGDDELEGSDVILPPPDLTLAEARNEFTGEGLIPD